MRIRRSAAALVLLLAFAGPAAAAQGVKIAGDPAAPAGPPPPAAGAPPSAAAASAPTTGAGADEEPKPKPKSKTKAAKKSAKPKKRVPESRYKTRKLAESTEESYRFDEDGNPLGGASKKKSAAKAKADEKTACAVDDSCSDKDKKTTDADAL